MTRLVSIAIIAVLAATVAALPVTAADQVVKNLGSDSIKTIRTEETVQEPWWVRNTDPRYVAYGIKIESLNGTDESPWIKLTGTKGTSRAPAMLDNGHDNLDGGYEYFLISGNDIGDVGIPFAIEFTASGGDAWSFQHVEIDYVITPEADAAWRASTDAMAWFAQFRDYNSREKIVEHLNGYPGQEWDKFVVKQISFPGKYGVSADDESHDIKYPPSNTVYGSGWNQPGGGSGSGTASLQLSSEIVIIDARSTGQEELTWSSSQKQSVSAGEVKEAVKAKSKTTGWENTTTVGVKLTQTGSTGNKVIGQTESKGEFSVENKFSVKESNVRSSSDKDSANLSGSYSSENGQKYTVKAGQLAFLQLGRTASVQQYSDYPGVKRIAPTINVTYTVTPVYYEVDCRSGKLRALRASGTAGKVNTKDRLFTYGPALDDPSQRKYFDLANQAFGVFQHTVPPTCAPPPVAGVDVPAASPPPAATSTGAGLEIAFVDTYEKIWDDSGSGADQDVSIWRPQPAAGWHRVGHHLKLGHAQPSSGTMVVRETTPGALASPVGYTQVWTDAGSGAAADAWVGVPLCPNGYKALGFVANSSAAPPGSDEVKCIRESALVPALGGAPIWNDAGSGASQDFGAWAIQAPAQGTTGGLFYGAASHSPPSPAQVDVLYAIK